MDAQNRLSRNDRCEDALDLSSGPLNAYPTFVLIKDKRSGEIEEP